LADKINILAELRREQEQGGAAPAPSGGDWKQSIANAILAARGPVLSAAQGLSMGFGDELAAGVVGGYDSLVKGADFGESYDNFKRQAEQPRLDWQKENPWSAAAFNVAGALHPGGKIAKGFGVAKEGLPMLGNIGRSLAAAAVQGGAQGAGEGDSAADRLRRAILSGAISGVAGGAISGIGGVAGKGGEALLRKAKGINPADWAILQETRNIPQATLKGAQETIEGAAKAGVPMRMLDPLVPDGVGDIAWTVSAGKPGQAVAGPLTEALETGRPARLRQVLDDTIGASRSAEVVGGDVRASAQKSIDEAIGARAAVSNPAYEVSLKTGRTIENPNLLAELTDPGRNTSNSDILAAIAGGRKTYKSELYGLPDNDIRVLDASKKHLDDLYNSHIAAGENDAAFHVDKVRKKLLSYIDPEARDYAAARGLYAGMTPPVKELEKGLIGSLARTQDPTLRGIPSRIMQMTPTEIQGLHKNLRADDLMSSARSYLDDLIGADNVGSKAVRALGKGDNTIDRLKAAILGNVDDLSGVDRLSRENAFNRLANNFDLENMTKRGTDVAVGNSKTAKRIPALNDYAENLDDTLKQTGGSFYSLAMNMLKDTFRDPQAKSALEQEVAKRMFAAPGISNEALGVTGQEGLDALKNILIARELLDPLRSAGRQALGFASVPGATALRPTK
jgi:hypothetical protein